MTKSESHETMRNPSEQHDRFDAFPPFIPFIFPPFFRSALIILYIVPMNSESITYLLSSLYSTVFLTWCWSQSDNFVSAQLSYVIFLADNHMVKLLFCATATLLEIYYPWVTVLGTHKVSYRSFFIFSNSPAKRPVDAFRLNLNRAYTTTWHHGKFYYLSVCVALFSLSVDCAGAQHIFAFTQVKLTIKTLMGVPAGAAFFWTVLGSSCRVIYWEYHLQRNVRVLQNDIIKEAGWPNTKGLDILGNHSLWNVIDGGADFCALTAVR